MGRRNSLFLFVLGLVLAGMVYAQTLLAQGKLFNQLVETSKAEMAKKGGKLKIALQWTKSDVKKVFPAFRNAFPCIKKITYTRERGTGPMARYLT